MLETLRTATPAATAVYGMADIRQPGGLNATVRNLLARLSQRAPGSAVPPRGPSPRRPEDEGWDDSDGPGRARLGLGIGDARLCHDEAHARVLWAEAHAAFRSVEGSKEAALDAALAVVEGEVARLRSAVRTYGEALKAIRMYGAGEERDAASAALRHAPVPLGSSPPVPHDDAPSTARGLPRG